MKLADVSIRRPVFATMVILGLVVFGVIGYLRVGVDLFPNVEFPFVTVTAVYPGADPEAVETKVVQKLEDALAGISGLKMLRSMSLENVGQVVLQFVLEKNPEEAAQAVRDKVSETLRELPKEVEPPVVNRIDLGATPVLSVVLSGRRSVREMTDLAEDVVKQRLQQILDVGGVDVVGGRKREIQVWVQADLLAKHNLAVQDVFMTLAAQNLEVPGGRLRQGQEELVVKTKGEVHDAQAIADLIIPIPNMGGAPIRVRDVARVVDSTEEPRSYSSLNGVSAISLTVRKQSGTNTTQVAKRLRDEVAKLSQELAPKGVSLATVADQSLFIEGSVSDVKFDLVFGAFLAVIIILFFLRNWRTTLISAVAIPTSVVATFAFIYFMKFTLNWMTLLALSLSIGILIDDAIVVIENIYRNMEGGMARTEAAHFGTAEIGLAVLATTFSIVAVFVPVAFMKGMVGRFFYEFGVTVSVAVLISLFVSFTLTPMLSSRFVKVSHRQNPIFRGIERVLSTMDRAYRATLAVALRHRLAVIMLAFAVLGLSVYLARFIKQEFVPQFDRSEFTVTVQLPTGKALAATRRYAEALAREVREFPGVMNTFITAGGGVQQKVNEATIYVNIVPFSRRTFRQAALMGVLRDRFARRRGAIISVEDLPIISVSGVKQSPIQFNIRGQSLEQMAEVAHKVEAEMRKIPGIVDVDDSYRAGKPEVSIQVDRDRAASLGVPVASIATTVRALMGGDKASQLRERGSLYDVRVRLQAEDRVRLEDLTQLKVRSSLGALVELSNLVKVNRGSGPTQIDRQARQRQVTIFANLQDKPMGDAMAEIRKIAARVVPPGFTSDFSGMAEEMDNSFGELFFALFMAVALVYMILASQFESFIHPFTIMLSLPLSLVGALGGLLAARTSMSIFGMIGIIMLMGLVTKNAILLIDYTSTLRKRGRTREQALLEAGPVRLRPILMTTAAMVFGMLPVALGLGEGGEMRSPMAICVIGGLITSTLLTLLVVPVVYTLLDGLSERIVGHRHGTTEDAKKLEVDAA